MEPLTDLKAILHSKRANIYYIEKCRVMVKGGRVVYLSEDKKYSAYWNIPIANTTVVLLGTGTAITQAAMRMLASAGVLVGFSGGGGTPLIAGTEIEWLTPASEYRPTEYVQAWVSFWFDESKRIAVAKQFQISRINFLLDVFEKDSALHEENIYADDKEIISLQKMFVSQIKDAPSIEVLLSIEATITKLLYKYVAKKTGLVGFTRQHDDPNDDANSFLNHGNYLAYGLAASTLWVLGIPHGFPVMHGKTRRGALVFDVADLVKDALVLPWAFIAAKHRYSENEYRELCLNVFTRYKAMDFMFEQIEAICITFKGSLK